MSSFKDLKISKELLSEVLGYKVDTFLGITKNEIDYTCCKDEDEGYIDTSINIYEFAFKCKEWIIDKGYHISTDEDKINNYIYLYKMIKNDFGYEIDKSKGVQFDSKGYINNLLEACEWILNQEVGNDCESNSFNKPPTYCGF